MLAWYQSIRSHIAKAVFCNGIQLNSSVHRSAMHDYRLSKNHVNC